MSNPRLTISFNEINLHVTTFKSSGISASDIVVGTPGPAVALTADSTVSKGSAGNRLFGQVLAYQSDGLVSVADEGYVTFLYSGTAPTLGASVECDGTGKVQAAAATNNLSRDNFVVSVNTTATTCAVQLR